MIGAAELSGNIDLQRPSGSNNPLDEPPLLEDLGIDVDHIKEKIKSVLLFKKLDDKLLVEPDMGGPLLFFIVFGVLLLLAGKLHFGYIYGFGMIGSCGICLLMNVMAQNREIDLYRTVSLLGYCLLPVMFLAAAGVLINLNSMVGAVMGFLGIAWSTITASQYFETVLAMSDQRFLAAYPIALFYACFTLITVF
jgi:hypothetical protein